MGTPLDCRSRQFSLLCVSKEGEPKSPHAVETLALLDTIEVCRSADGKAPSHSSQPYAISARRPDARPVAAGNDRLARCPVQK